MNILMTLSNPFTHDPRVENEAKSLIKQGHNVTVLAWDRKKQNLKNEKRNEIDIVRVFNTQFMNILPYDILKLYFWEKEGYKEALKLHEKNPFDLVHCHNLDTLSIGVKLKKKLGITLIYDAHEIWGYMVAKDLPKVCSDHFLKKEKKIINDSDRIITVNEPLKNYFKDFTKKEITIVMNCKHLLGRKYEPVKNKQFTLIYIGMLNKSRFLLELVEVVEEIPDVRLIIGGIGKENYVEELKEKCKKLDNVDFIGPVPSDKVVPMTKKSDAIVCIFDPYNKNNQVGLPNKIFEAAVCGRPMIITKGLYYEKIVVDEGDFGISVNFSKEDLKNGIMKLKEDKELQIKLGQNALKQAIEKYNWEKQEEKIKYVFKEFTK